MTAQQNMAQAAIDLIRQNYAAQIVRCGILPDGDIELEIQAPAILPLARLLRDDPKLDFRYFNFMLATDRVDHLELIYVLNSLISGLRLRLKTQILPNEPKIDSVTAVWRGANWHEREAYDMLGITFIGHPYPRRMFLDDDFEGYPLRKSFKLAGRAEQ